MKDRTFINADWGAGGLNSKNNLVLDTVTAENQGYIGSQALEKPTTKYKRNDNKGRGNLAIILSACFGILALLITMICSIVVSENAVMTDWADGLTAQALGAETWEGAGTRAEPFVISTEIDLAQLAVNVNAGVDYKDKFFTLSSTLNLSGKHWTAIGTETNPFRGTFDGNGNSIWYMTGIKPDVTSYGLFGVMGEDSVVTKVTLFNPIIYGGGNVGSIAGECRGEVSYCSLLDSYDQYGSYLYENKSLKYVEISNYLIDAGSYKSSYSSGTASNQVDNGSNVSGSGNVGGIVGYLNVSDSSTAIVLKCLARSATIQSSDNDTGGIVGEARAYATNKSGSDCRSRIAACLAGNLTVKCTSTGSYDVGGIVGYMEAGATSTNYKSGNVDTFTNLAINCTLSCRGKKGAIVGNMSTTNSHGYTRLYDNYSYGNSTSSIYGTKDSSGNLYTQGNYNTTSVNNVTCTSSSIPSYLSNYGSYPQESNSYSWSGNWVAITPTQSKGVKSYYTPAPSGLTSYWVETKTENLSYTISYALNSGTAGSSKPTSYTYSTSKQTKALSNPTRTNYTFSSWTVSWTDSSGYGGTKPSVSGTTLTIPASTYGNITLTANWTAASYTISYTMNSGSKGTYAPTSYSVSSSSQTLTVSTPSRSNYIFNGWTVSWTNSTYGGTKPSISGTKLKIPANTYGNITLTANWTQNTFYVYAYYNTSSSTSSYSRGTTGGSVGFDSSCGSSSTSTSTSNSSVYRYASAATGYAFDGWYTSSSFSSRESTNTSYSSSTLKLYAKFSIQQYTATIKPNGGTWNGSTSDQTKKQYYNTTLSLDTPTRTGYDFNGWTKSGSGSLSGTTFTFGAGSATITANWTIKSFTVTVQSSDTSQGTVSGGGTVNYGSTTTITATPKEGYKFVGWKLNSNSSYASTSASYSPKITAACTYTAYFQILTFTVTTTIEGTGGTLTGSGTYNWGTTVTVTAAPGDGYYLAGLYVNNTQVTADANYKYSFVIKENKTVKAVFKIANYLTSANSGGEVRISTTSTNATYTAIPYAGYYLNGWYIDGVLYTLNGSTVQDRQITLSKDKAYSVTVNAVFGSSQTTSPSNDFDGTNGFSICSQAGGEVRVNGYTTSDTTIHVSAVFTDFGYVFKGWYIYGSDTALSTNMSCNLNLSDIKGKVIVAKFDVDNTSKNDTTNNTDEIL